jgi:hypothetical protein
MIKKLVLSFICLSVACFANAVDLSDPFKARNFAAEHLSGEQVFFLWIEVKNGNIDVLKKNKVLKGINAVYLSLGSLEGYEDIKTWLSDYDFDLVALDVDEEDQSIKHALFLKQNE